MPHRLRRIHPDRHPVPGCGCDDLGTRLHQAALGGDQVDVHQVGRVTGQLLLERLEVQDAGSVDRQWHRHQTAVRERLQVRAPLGGRHPHPGAVRERPDVEQRVEGRGRALDERDAVGVAAQQAGDVTACCVEPVAHLFLGDVPADLGLEPRVRGHGLQSGHRRAARRQRCRGGAPTTRDGRRPTRPPSPRARGQSRDQPATTQAIAHAWLARTRARKSPASSATSGCHWTPSRKRSPGVSMASMVPSPAQATAS